MCNLLSYERKIGGCRCDARTIFQSRNAVVSVTVAAEARAAIAMRSRPELCWLDRGEVKRRWQDANDKIGVAIQRDCLAYDRSIGRKAALPSPVAEHHSRDRVGLIFSAVEVPPEERRDAECSQKTIADAGSCDLLSLRPSLERKPVRLKHIHRSEDTVLLPQIDEVVIGDVVSRADGSALK